MLKIKSDSMNGALDEARRLLGSGAVVLHAKQYEEPVLWGLGKKQGVEILAAPGQSAPAAPAQVGIGRLDVIEQGLDDIRRSLATLSTPPKKTSESAEKLVRRGVSESVAEAVLYGVPDSDKAVLDAVSRRIRCVGGPAFGRGQARLALVGPTGVGKTTTAAKLAARYSLFEKKKVALVTLDTYRVGAVDQLATYARILNIPIEVAFSAADCPNLMKKHADKDLIIVDTVGRSQRRKEQLLELGSFLKAVKPTETHLVVSASSDSDARREAIEGFSALGADRLLLTKLDECSKSGCVLELAAGSLLPFTFVTCGQDVPDDIALAESGALAKFVWEGLL